MSFKQGKKHVAAPHTVLGLHARYPHVLQMLSFERQSGTKHFSQEMLNLPAAVTQCSAAALHPAAPSSEALCKFCSREQLPCQPAAAACPGSQAAAT